MTLILASRPNVYSSSPLDRIATRREDPAWIAEKLADPDTLFVPVWRTKNLVRGTDDGEPEAVYISGEMAHTLRMEQDGPWAFLGHPGRPRGLRPRHLRHRRPGAVAARVPRLLRRSALRRLGRAAARRPRFSPMRAACMHWRQRHKFCGVCGNACEVKSSGHVMQCTVCNTQHFPRTDPAVIMLVHRGDRALLGHSTRFPRATMYSTLAGFVEPGETLEEAVRREVLEESGIQVGDVHYHSSQPWPFPGNIMLGFYAEGLTEEITIDPEELKDARWFTRDQMRNCEQHGFALPRVDSIARRLIEDWLAHG